jgi:phytoene dehydrogenase-like protein
MSPDAIVIGAGPNGLAAAGILARAGRRVLVLERNSGAPASDWEAGWVLPALVRDLALDRHGWAASAPDPWLTIPLAAGGTLALHRDVRRTAEAIRRVSPADAARWPEFCERAGRVAGFLARLYAAPPPRPVSDGAGDLLQLARIARRARGLGRTGLMDLLRWMPMPVQDTLDDWFTHDALKGALGALAVSGTCHGPRAGGTTFVLLHHHAGSPPGVFRSESHGLRGALATAARAHGVDIRTGVQVARVLMAGERAAGVVLATGEEITASLIVSSADPRRTFLDLAGPDCLDPDFVRAVQNIRFRGACALVELSTAAHPPFAALAVAPTLDHLERAADAAKYGRVSTHPVVDCRSTGPSPDGRHRLSALVQYAPYALRDGPWDEAARSRVADAALSALRALAPSLADARVERSLSPADLETQYGLTEGSLTHGELALDQILFMRPVAGWARYRTPVPGLYLGGAGAHPGGGVPGAAGYLAARTALREARPSK